ncbi:MAG: HAMP domain-containing histidine kinase [Muribaculaceae bacterium]|nr:HAMP domain-containing histidine kinase [Muribaculaceae bacterium]
MKISNRPLLALLFVLIFGGVIYGALRPYPAEVMPARPSSPTTAERVRLHKYIRSQLAKGPSAKDSLRMCYDLFDLGPVDVSGPMIDTIYDLAVRTGNRDAQLDMLRQKANLYMDSAAVVDRCLDIVENMMGPNDNLARETATYIKMQKVLQRVGNSVQISDNTLETSLNGLIARYISNPPTDPYERFEVIFAICTYMGNLGEGKEMEHYAQLMREALEELPLATGAIRHAVFTRSAVGFTNFGLYRQALDSDRRLLTNLDSIEARYDKSGRIFHSYDATRYGIYRRMLANAAGLRRPEIDRLWSAIQEIASRNVDVAHDMEVDKRAQIYYLIAVEEYDKVVPMIMSRIRNKSRSLPYREILYNALITAAEHTGNEAVLLDAYRVYTEMLRERLNNRQAESIRELSVAYSVNDLKEENAMIQKELAERQRARTMTVAISSVLVVLMLITLLIVMWRQKRRATEQAATIENINASLVAERDKLREMKGELISARDEAKRSDKIKTDFVNNMSHEIRTPLTAINECSRLIVDCIPEDKRVFLDKFGRVIEQNVKLIDRLVTDVLDVASLDNNALSIEPMACAVVDMCAPVLTTASELVRPGVEFKFEPSEEAEHTVVVTDRERVCQVLMNLLDNAAKFTERGLVTLEVDVRPEKGVLEFVVSDTGIGIRKGNEEKIFERFRQLDTSVSGCGLGLYIARVVARLLGGDVVVDTDFRGGARFVFTLPLEMGK